ncbi:MAG TPA: 4Fe-4S dicluster-binding protein [Chloroflexota bacterium]|jgi:pyruvate ferredoxin oxidoreductase delta subunit|nr:4Fe-4S dicluster-binding protein [Chloroflexota bacterium]
MQQNGSATVTGSASWSVEVVYRGIFQKRLANRISRGVVLGARREGKVGTAFARYGDSPERNGVPAKNFAVVATDDVELESSLARYEPTNVDVSIVVDDTMCKGIESWAWYGIQPINKLVLPGGTLIVTSARDADDLLRAIKVKPYAYTLAVVPSQIHAGVFAPEGSASFAGLWLDNDDDTDFNCLAAVARVAPAIISLDAVLEIVRERTGSEARVEAVKAIYGQIQLRQVQPGEGSTIEYEEYTKPGWTKMREGIIVEAMKVGTRNPIYKKWSTRTRRPLVNFDTCIKCTQCWLQCPDECFEVTPEGTYEVVYEACIGCSICAEVCPVPDCITMVNELQFDTNDNLYPLYQSNRDEYNRFLELHNIPLHPELIDRAKKTAAVHAQPTAGLEAVPASTAVPPAVLPKTPVVAGGEE